MELNKIALRVAGLATLVVGWCLYFDHRRRKDPGYKKSVKEKRMRKKTQPSTIVEIATPQHQPILLEKDAMQEYFLQEIQNGENCIISGLPESSIDHFVNAVVLCGQPSQLLIILEQTLPGPVFEGVVLRIKDFSVQMEIG